LTSDVLHITNGDSAANIISNSKLSGEVLPWRDPMHHGPCPASQSLDELSRIRIAYLSNEFGDDSDVVQVLPPGQSHGFSERDATLIGSNDFDEVVLWFEHDLLDQLQLLQLLGWFAQHGSSSLTLSLICIDNFPGVQNFRGIGQLSSTQMASLFVQRKPVTQAQFDVAVKFWQAFCHSDPTDLLNLCLPVGKCEESLPFLISAILRHLQEFPWVSDGLTRTERQILQLVDSGIANPINVFSDNMNFESCLFIGDWRSYAHINELCMAEQPLLACATGVPFQYPPGVQGTLEQFSEQELFITELGREVLAGQKSILNTHRRNSWLGGVHLSSEKGLWCWDDQRSQMLNTARFNR